MHTHKTVLTSVKSGVNRGVNSGVKVKRGKLWLAVSRQEFSAVETLIEQLSLLIDKVFSNKDLEFFRHTEVAWAFTGSVRSGPINDVPR